MKIIFWACALFILYTYFGYPLWLALLKRLRPRPVKKGDYEPTVSVVIAAHNEERNIVSRVQNTLIQDYPSDKLEIIVASDGSTDRTVDVLRQMELHSLEVIDLPLNQGKAVALNTAVAQARGEIIVFTDSRQTFAPDVIRHLAANFFDSKVGCVSGELVFLQDEASVIQAEMGVYWKYEKWIRKAESATGSVVGATGAIYAIRKTLFRTLPQGTLIDDVLTPMNIVMQGSRCIFDGSAVAYDIISKDVSQEWQRKVRTLAGNWQLLSLVPKLFLPWHNPILLRFLSHKICRLIVPFLLPVLFMTSIMVQQPIYKSISLLQLMFYFVALMASLLPEMRKVKIVNLSYFFLVMNFAAAVGFWRWITGQCSTAWQPAYIKEVK